MDAMAAGTPSHRAGSARGAARLPVCHRRCGRQAAVDQQSASCRIVLAAACRPLGGDPLWREGRERSDPRRRCDLDLAYPARTWLVSRTGPRPGCPDVADVSDWTVDSGALAGRVD